MDINDLKRRLMMRLGYFGEVIQSVRYLESNCKTACTDGLRVYFNPKYMNTLSTDEQLFVLAHELLHVAYNHIFRGAEKKHKVWNIATDAVINQQLIRDCGLKMPKGGVNRPDAYDCGAQEYYEKLLKEKQNNQSNKGNSTSGAGSAVSGNGDGGSDDDFDDDFDEYGDFEEHDLWETARKIANGEELTEEEKELYDKIKEAIDKIKDEKDAAEKNREYQNELKKRRRSRQNSRKRGSGASNSCIKLKAKELEATHEVPWQILLDDLVGGKGYYDYTQPKQVRYGIVSDSWRLMPTIKLEIAIDVSGSVSEDLVRNFLSECKGIFSAAESKLQMKIGFFDTKFMAPLDDGTYSEKISAETKTIDAASDIDKLEIPGGGGTDFKVALSGFDDVMANKIVFTDGCADYASLPEMDVIWIVYGQDPPQIDPPGAKGVIYVKGEQFDALSGTHFINEPKTKGLSR